MNKRNFLKNSTIIGAFAPFFSLVPNAQADEQSTMRTTYKVGILSYDGVAGSETAVNHKKCTLKDLKQGDFFEMYEHDGTKVVNDGGYSIFQAVEEPFMRDDGLWTVQSEPVA